MQTQNAQIESEINRLKLDVNLLESSLGLNPISPNLDHLDTSTSWGLPAGQKDLFIKYEIVSNPIYTCPHCQSVIDEKGLYCDDNNKTYHRSCRGEVNYPSDNNLDIINYINGLLSTTLPESSVIDNKIIVESLPKSIKERIHRRTRKIKRKGKRNLLPVIKKDADNDPRQTSVGRNSLNDSQKKNRDEKMSRPDWYSESIEFVRDRNKPIDEMIPRITKLKSPLFILSILEGLNNKDDSVNNLIRAVSSVLESSNYSECYISKLGDESEAKVKILAESRFNVFKRFMSNAKLETIRDEKHNTTKFIIHALAKID